MKKEDNRIFFYLAFLVLAVLLVWTVSEGKLRASDPAEYVYWEEESQASSEPVSSEADSSGDRASRGAGENPADASSGPTSSAPEPAGLPGGEKQYLSSEPSSMPAVSSEAESESEGEPESSEEQGDKTGLININTASRSELCRLNGIGEVLAGRIIEFREKAGGFDSIEEIMEVSGIGEKKFAAIRDDITV